ncbi:lysosomal-associated transmembrane protein 4B isoform X3 [Lathamus discolor]|uniref:lysosomal-associated transmembrane protein 4B isoform X3 n=1 Tax=Lathamus discolor TaxID=678569 RepID=UPI0032B7346E
MQSSAWARFYSNSCCLCCHVRTGTIILGVWYLIINSVVLLILLSALTDPDQYHLTSAELGGEFEFMDDANMCIATAISLLMILICAMATYGAYKQHAAWIIPFFCYQIFDFALNTLVAISVLVYPSTIQDYLRQLMLVHWKSSRGIIQKVLSGKEQIMASCQVLQTGTATGWSPSAHPLPAVPCFCISASPAPVAAQVSVWLQEFSPLQSRSCNQVLLSLGHCGTT